MNSDFKPSKEFEQLLVVAAEGEMNDGHRSRLNELVANDADSRQYYVEYMTTHAMLNWRHGNVPELKVAIVDEADDEPRKHDWLSWTISLTVAASLLLSLSWAVWRAVIYQEPIATVIGAEGLVPGDGPALNEGDVIRPGVYRFESGVVQVELKTGVIIVMQGPIELSLSGNNRARLIRGAIRAYVAPKARGFTIETSKVEIVDLGTEFGVMVDKHDHVEVHVFKGKVQLNNLEVSAGEALHVHMEPSKGTGKNQFNVYDVTLNDKMFPSI